MTRDNKKKKELTLRQKSFLYLKEDGSTKKLKEK